MASWIFNMTKLEFKAFVDTKHLLTLKVGDMVNTVMAGSNKKIYEDMYRVEWINPITNDIYIGGDVSIEIETGKLYGNGMADYVGFAYV